jgi:hypothetical protein
VIIYKPENKVFNSRKEAKEYLGNYFFRKMIREKDERLIIINRDCVACDESIYKDTILTEESNQ